MIFRWGLFFFRAMFLFCLLFSCISHIQARPVHKNNYIAPTQFISAPSSEIPGLFAFDITLNKTHLFVSNPEARSVRHYYYTDDASYRLHRIIQSKVSPTFGWSVAMNDTDLVISDPINSTLHFYSLVNGEAVTAQAPITWHPVNDFFGSEVVMDNQLLLVGAPLNNSQRGIVQIYQKEGSEWAPVMTLTGPETCMHFGYRIALGENYIAVLSQEYSQPVLTAWNQFLKGLLPDAINPEQPKSGLLAGRVMELAHRHKAKSLAVPDPNCGVSIISRKDWHQVNLLQRYTQYHKSALWRGDMLVTGELEYFPDLSGSGGMLRRTILENNEWRRLPGIFTGLEFGRCLGANEHYLAVSSPALPMVELMGWNGNNDLYLYGPRLKSGSEKPTSEPFTCNLHFNPTHLLVGHDPVKDPQHRGGIMLYSLPNTQESKED